MSGAPRVSIAMGVHNDEEFIAQAVESILNQSYTDFEFIIVEDAPTDATPAVLDRFDDDRIVRLANESNRGLTRSLNRALEHAEGDYIARQDADDRSAPDRLARQVDYLDGHGDVGCLGTSACLIDETGRARAKRVTLTHPTLEDFRRTNQVVHGSAMLRRDALDAVGPYDERFAVAQDYELWLRMVREWPIRNLEAPLYDLRLRDDSVYVNRQRESLLYAELARRSVEEDDSTVESGLATGDVEAVYDALPRDRQLAVDRAAATALLRYGDRSGARGSLDRCADRGHLGAGGWLLYLLTFLPGRVVGAGIGWYRRYLNLKTRAINRVRR